MKIILFIEEIGREITTRPITYIKNRTENLIADIFNNHYKVCSMPKQIVRENVKAILSENKKAM